MPVIESVDAKIIAWVRRWYVPCGRFALFAIFFWFGMLKVLDLSPAAPLVVALQHRTLPFIDFEAFLLMFGLFEALIGLTFLSPKLARVSIALLAFHMLTTLLPLVLLPNYTWRAFMVPTLEGQYIIKNMALMAVAMGIAAQVTPLRERKTAG